MLLLLWFPPLHTCLIQTNSAVSQRTHHTFTHGLANGNTIFRRFVLCCQIHKHQHKPLPSSITWSWTFSRNIENVVGFHISSPPPLTAAFSHTHTKSWHRLLYLAQKLHRHSHRLDLFTQIQNSSWVWLCVWVLRSLTRKNVNGDVIQIQLPGIK